MVNHDITDLTESLSRLTPLGFETFIFKLVQSLPGASDVKRNLRAGGTEIDIAARIGSELVIFETKQRIEPTAAFVDAIVHFAGRARTSFGASRVILVAPRRIPQIAVKQLGEWGVEYWGIEEIAERTTSTLWSWLNSDATRKPSRESLKSKADGLASTLAAIAPGLEHAREFQKLWSDATEFLFSPPLGIPQFEVPDEARRNRRDIILENFAESGFWSVMRTEYVARYVVIDAKNHCEEVGKRAVLEIAHYLKRHGCGLFALLATRFGAKGSARHAIREQWIAESKMILVLDDTDLERMLMCRADGADPTMIIRERLRSFVFSL